MGQMVRTSDGEQVFVPEYRITFGFKKLPTTTRIVRVQGNTKAHLYGLPKDAVTNAIKQAEIMLAFEYTNGHHLGEYVMKVEREWESGKGWDEITTAYRAVPGTKITIWSVSSNHDGHGVRPYFANITVGRWEGNGDGTATLIDERGQHCGIYERDDVFVTC